MVYIKKKFKKINYFNLNILNFGDGLLGKKNGKGTFRLKLQTGKKIENIFSMSVLKVKGNTGSSIIISQEMLKVFILDGKSLGFIN